MITIHTLMRASIDYAGLFPPAQLAMATAVAKYAAYRAGAMAWALGRFVVPVARLEEFAGALPYGAAGWRLAALAGVDLQADLERIAWFNRRYAASAVIDTLELKADRPEAIVAAARATPAELTMYIELPAGVEPCALIAAIAHFGARAKVRTGGVTPDAFPHPDELLRFIGACVAAGVPFKATAGLHHPLRDSYRLTYAPDSPSGVMYGFLNVFLAAALLCSGVAPAEAAPVLTEGDLRAFDFHDDGITWRGLRLSIDALAHAREQSVISFGSCSFDEPIGELSELGLL
jgi:hypothetical protein